MKGFLYAGIGDMVDQSVIISMSLFIEKHGETAFIAAVYEGAFSEYAYAYIHPCDEMRGTQNFDIIQKAFLNAYT